VSEKTRRTKTSRRAPAENANPIPACQSQRIEAPQRRRGETVKPFEDVKALIRLESIEEQTIQQRAIALLLLAQSNQTTEFVGQARRSYLGNRGGETHCKRE
jgi:hypothetical protein